MLLSLFFLARLLTEMQLGRILEFRHNESMRTQTQALTQLSKDQNASAEQTAQVQVAMSNDSRLLKALTVLATLYLPASLVAVSGGHYVQGYQMLTPRRQSSAPTL